MMLETIRNKILAKLFEDGFKKIERLDWMTSVLKVCFKNKLLKATWNSFLNSVESMIEDAKDEIRMARTWTNSE